MRAVRALKHIHDLVIDHVTDAGEMAAQDLTVELVAVDNQKPPVIGGFVDDFIADCDLCSFGESPPPQWRYDTNRFIMIAGHINQLCTLVDFACQLVKDTVVILVPVPALGEFPAVDYIADEVKITAFHVLEKIEQGGGIKTFGADMKIRQENRAEIARTMSRDHAAC